MNLQWNISYINLSNNLSQSEVLGSITYLVSNVCQTLLKVRKLQYFQVIKLPCYASWNITLLSDDWRLFSNLIIFIFCKLKNYFKKLSLKLTSRTQSVHSNHINVTKALVFTGLLQNSKLLCKKKCRHIISQFTFSQMIVIPSTRRYSPETSITFWVKKELIICLHFISFVLLICIIFFLYII